MVDLLQIVAIVRIFLHSVVVSFFFSFLISSLPAWARLLLLLLIALLLGLPRVRRPRPVALGVVRAVRSWRRGCCWRWSRCALLLRPSAVLLSCLSLLLLCCACCVRCCLCMRVCVCVLLAVAGVAPRSFSPSSPPPSFRPPLLALVFPRPPLTPPTPWATI